MAASMLPSIWLLFKFNLLLQIFDGLFTYYVLTRGVPEANPFIRDAIYSWGEIWGLVYWKVFACALLALLFTLRHLRQGLSFKALTLTSTVYSYVFIVSVYYFLLDLFG